MIDPADEQAAKAAMTTLRFMRWSYKDGGQLWTPPHREPLPDDAERNPEILHRQIKYLEHELAEKHRMLSDVRRIVGSGLIVGSADEC